MQKPLSQLVVSGLVCAVAAWSWSLRPACAEQPAAPGTPGVAQADNDGDMDIGLSKKEVRKAIDREKATALCKKFAYDGDSFVDSKYLQDEGAKLARDSSAKALLIESLDPRNFSEAQLRRGALSALNEARFIGADVSHALMAVALADPSEDLRKAAVAAIKLRKDDAATSQMLDYLMTTYDEAGNVKVSPEHDNAVDALRDLAAGDSRIYQSLVQKAYYATVECRITSTQLVNFVTRQIDSFTVNSGAQVNLIIPLSFPIQFPELAITRVRTTVKAPCINALEELSGENFGEDAEKWDKWFRKRN